MDARKIVILSMVICSVLGQEGSDYGYLAQLKMSLREEKIPSIINFILKNESLEAHEITTQDIISLSKLDKYDQNDLVKVLEFFNVSDVYNVNNLEGLLTTLDISFRDFYDDLITKLGLSGDQVTTVINSLSIPGEFWRDYALHQDQALYNDLRKGVYDEEHVALALEAIGKDMTQVYSAARDLLAEKVTARNSSEFVAILTANGWNMQTVLAWYRALNFTTRDLYEVEKFREIFTNITDQLNKNVTLGVFTGPNRLALHRVAYEDLDHDVDGVVVKIEANGVEVTLSKTRNLGDRIVEVPTNQTGPHYIQITESYNSTEACTYVTLLDGRAEATEVTVTDFTVSKNLTRFILGSPLICEGSLYGLAGAENDDVIVLDRFYTEDQPQPPEEVGDDNENQGGGGNAGLSLLPCVLIVTFNFLITLVLL